jgi:hypothetical protein
METVTLSITESQRAQLASHLFPQDGNEAVAIALCGRSRSASRHRLTVRRVVPVPYDVCTVRKPDRVSWPTEFLLPLIQEAGRNGWAIVKVHGHRGYPFFSSVDNTADQSLFPSLYSWLDSPEPLGSAILMDDGNMFGRVVDENATFQPFQCVTVIGDDLHFYFNDATTNQVEGYGERIAQTFGAGTYKLLRRLRVGVVGASGTGSAVIEQLARNCVGHLVIVDPDHVEEKNLNRILNSSMEDALSRRPKVSLAQASVARMGLGTTVTTIESTLFHPDVVRELASCDVLFGCMDTVDGRFLLNKLAAFYLLPYIDLGVKLQADGHGGVEQVAGSVHYIKPDGSSLLSRNVFTMEQVRVAGMKRTDPERYRQEVAEGYIKGVQEDRPAVVHINSLIASLAVNELLARLHPFRIDPNDQYAITRVSLSHGIFQHEPEGQSCPVISRHVGKGDTTPLLEWAELSAGVDHAMD